MDVEHGVDPDEPMIAVDPHLPCLASYHAAGWAGTEATTWLRAGVVERLVAAADRLPDGYGFAVFDGWRSPDTVRALYDHFYGPGSTLAPGYLADPDAANAPGAPPPPHVTGGAVDLTLTLDGTPLELGTPFDEFTPRAALDALANATDPDDRRNHELRRLLHAALGAVGFAPYDQEWWHVSWGDHAWAEHHGLTGDGVPTYGATRPTR